MSDAAEQTQELSIYESFKVLLGASRGFWLVNLINFGEGIFYFAILNFLTIFLTDRLGMTEQGAGLSASTFTGLVTLFMIGGGFVSDRFGVRRALTLSLLLIGAGRVLLAAAPSPVFAGLPHGIAVFSLFLMALGNGVLQPALYAGVKEYTDPRTAAIGYGLLYSIMNLGIVAESFISPFIRTGDTFINGKMGTLVGLGWGIDGVYWVCTALTGLMILTHLTFFTRKVEVNDRWIKEDGEKKQEEDKRPLLQRIRDLPILDPRFMFFIFILLPVRTLFAHQFLTMPQYIQRAYPAEVYARFEWISGLNPLIIVICVPTIAALTRKVNVLTMMIIGTAVSAVTTFLLVPGPDLNALIAYTIIFSLGEALWSSRFLEYVADLAPVGKVGAYMGIAGIPWFLAKFTTGLYSGSMIAHFIPKAGAQDTSTMWLIYAIVACISPIGLLIGRKWVLAKSKPT